MEGYTGSQFYASIKKQIEAVALPQLAAYQRLPIGPGWKRCVLCGFPTHDECDAPGCATALCRQPWCRKRSCLKCKSIYCDGVMVCSFLGCDEEICVACDKNPCEGCTNGDFPYLCAKHMAIHEVQPFDVGGAEVPIRRNGCWRCRQHWTKNQKVLEHCAICARLDREHGHVAWNLSLSPCGFCYRYETCPHATMVATCPRCKGTLPACADHAGHAANGISVKCKQCKKQAKKQKL